MEITVNGTERGATAARQVGWIGAGKMGAPMIRTLLRAGVSVAVTAPCAPALQGLIAEAATDTCAAGPVSVSGVDA